MTYYDRWNDRNRRAVRKGEKDAELGWMTCRHYDRYSECGAAYEDGYHSKRREIERREEEREQEERQRIRREQLMAEHRRLEEQEYWERFEYEQQQEEEYYEQEYERYREILFRRFK